MPTGHPSAADSSRRLVRPLSGPRLGDRAVPSGRSALTLANLADKKSAKIIALLEELRGDQPDVADRVDTESDDMAKPTDPSAVAASIEAKASKSGKP